MSDRLKAIVQEVERMGEGERVLLLAHLLSSRQKLWRWPVKGRPRWEEVIGSGGPSVTGEDAQQWVSKSRSDDDRKRASGSGK
jgi:hypothetical protein